MIKKLFKTGLFNIMGANVINKVIAFVANILIVRILTKESYGIFTSAFNVYSIFALFSSLGMTSGILYFCSDAQDPPKRNSYYHYALRIGIISNAFFSLLIVGYGMLSNIGVAESGIYIVLLSLLPLVGYFHSYYSIVLRTRKENQKYALLLNINSVTYLVFATLGSLVGGIAGTIAGRYISYIITGCVGRYFCKRYLANEGVAIPSLSKDERRGMLKYCIPCCLTSALNNLLYLLDVALINALIPDAELIATYKVATVIPENLVFIPEAIIIVVYPYFVEHKDNAKWFSENTKKLVIGMVAVGIIITIGLIIFAPIIIRIAWGEQYLDAIIYFRILSVSVLFLCLRSTSTNLLACLGKVNFNLLVGIITGIANVVLDYVLISNYGATGAAIATVLVVVVAFVLSFPYLISNINKLNKTETDSNSSL